MNQKSGHQIISLDVDPLAMSFLYLLRHAAVIVIVYLKLAVLEADDDNMDFM